MKKSKFFLPLIAFVIAIGSAFTTVDTKNPETSESELAVTLYIPGSCQAVMDCAPNQDGPSCDEYNTDFDPVAQICSGNAEDGLSRPE